MAAAVFRIAVVLVVGLAVYGATRVVAGHVGTAITGMSSATHGNVFLQTILGTSIATAAMAWVYMVGKLVLATVISTLSTHATIHATIRQSVVRHIHQTRFGRLTRATITMRENALMTWAERRDALTKGLATRQATYSLFAQPMFEALSLPVPLQVDGQWLLLTFGDSETTAYLWGGGRTQELTRLLQSIVDADTALQAAAVPSRATLYVVTEATGAGAGAVPTWTRAGAIAPRNKASLCLPGDMLQDMLHDAETFYKSAAAYHARQQPFRRGWLLYGPPGTGKSTTPQVLATELDLPIFDLCLSNPMVNDTTLGALMKAVPPESIIILEDVDVACDAVRARVDSYSGRLPDVAAVGVGFGMTTPPHLTLAGLLNALDGVGAHEGHLVIMMTNEEAKLDRALRRPGRMDREFKLGFADRAQIQRLVRANLQLPDAVDVSALVDVIPNGLYTPAAIAAHCTRYATLQDAIAGIDQLVVYRSGFHSEPRATIYDALWAQGLERLFPSTLWHDGCTLHDVCFTLMCKLLVRPLVTSTGDYTEFYALAAALHQAYGCSMELGIRFAKSVLAWADDYALRRGRQPQITRDRLRRFFDMHVDAASAVDAVHVWFLRYGHRTSRGGDATPTIRHYLFSQGCCGLSSVTVAARGLRDILGIHTIADLDRPNMNTVIEGVRKELNAVCPGGELLADRLIHAVLHPTAFVSVRPLADKLTDAFDVPSGEAWKAAAEVCDPDGFLLLSMRNVAAILGQCASLGDVVARIRDTLATLNDGDVALPPTPAPSPPERKHHRRPPCSSPAEAIKESGSPGGSPIRVFATA